MPPLFTHTHTLDIIAKVCTVKVHNCQAKTVSMFVLLNNYSRYLGHLRKFQQNNFLEKNMLQMTE